MEIKRAVQTHLLSCDRCAAAWQRERRTSQLLQSLSTSQAQLSPQVAINIRARLSRLPRRWRHQFAAAVVAVCCLVFLGAVAAQLYPQQVQQAASWVGWKGFIRLQQLYRVGNVVNHDGTGRGHIVVTDPATQGEIRVFENITDMVVSPDQAKLFILQHDGIRAVVHQTRQELWHVPLPSLGGSVMVFGPSQMAVSPDGRWLYFKRPETQHGMLQIVAP